MPATPLPKVKLRGGMRARHSVGFGLTLTQRWTAKLWEDATRRKLLWETVVKNLVPMEGLNKYLDATFVSGLTGPLWYIGLINQTGFTAYDLTDTAAKITTSANPPTTNGWQELTAYSETNRQQWVPGSVASANVDNTLSPAAFTSSGSATILGAFMVSDNTKGGTSGVLIGEANFSAPQPVILGNVLDVVAACFFTP